VFGDDVVVLHQSDCRDLCTASFEVTGSCSSGDAEWAISRFCAFIENLPPNARRLWDQCCSRVFDIGYESGDSPRCFRSILHPETVARVASLGAAIMVTIYPPSMHEIGQDALPDGNGL